MWQLVKYLRAQLFAFDLGNLAICRFIFKGDIVKSKQQKSPLLKIVLAVIALLVLALGAYLGLQYYHHYQVNKIYTVNETVKFADFSMKIDKAEFGSVKLPINNEVAKKYGGVDKNESCDQLSNEGAWIYTGRNWQQLNGESGALSLQNVCKWRNEARQDIREYSSENKRLDIEYVVKTNNDVRSNDLKIEVDTDSGRDLRKAVDSLNSNLFFGHCMPEPQTFSLDGPPPGLFFDSGCTDEPLVYTPYSRTNLGDGINRGLQRRGSISTDIRKSENIIDIKISYKNETRIIRITR